MKNRQWTALAGLTVVIGLAVPASALDVRAGTEVIVGAGEVVDHDLYLFGGTVVIDGRVDGDVMASGGTVILRGEVTGDLMGCAQNLVLDGAVGDDVRIAGMAVRLGDGSRAGGDVMVASLSLDSATGSSVGGSVGFVGYQARLAGDVEQDLGASAVGIDIGGRIHGDVDVEVESEASPWLLRRWTPSAETASPVAPGLALAGGARIGGALTYTSTADARLAAGAQVNGAVRRLEPERPALAAGRSSGRVAEGLRWWLAMLVAGGVLLWRFPRASRGLADVLRSHPARSVGWGVVVALGWSLGVVFVLAATGSLLIATEWLTLGRLAGLVLILGAVSEALLVGGWVALFLLSPILLALVLGRALLARAGTLATRGAAWSLVAGLVVLGAVRLVPYGGVAVAVLSLLLGLGALWMRALGARATRQLAA